MHTRQISIQRSHFRYFYRLLDEPPWAEKCGYEKVASIPAGQFTTLMQREGSQAMATAVAIAQKDSRIRKAVSMQGELISRA